MAPPRPGPRPEPFDADDLPWYIAQVPKSCSLSCCGLKILSGQNSFLSVNFHGCKPAFFCPAILLCILRCCPCSTGPYCGSTAIVVARSETAIGEGASLFDPPPIILFAPPLSRDGDEYHFHSLWLFYAFYLLPYY